MKILTILGARPQFIKAKDKVLKNNNCDTIKKTCKKI